MSADAEELKGRLALERAEVKRLRAYIAALEARAAPDPEEGAKLRAQIAALQNDLLKVKEAHERGKNAWDLERSELKARMEIGRRTAIDYLKGVVFAPDPPPRTPAQEAADEERYLKLIKGLCILAGSRDKIIDEMFDPAVARIMHDINDAWAKGNEKIAADLEARLEKRLGLKVGFRLAEVPR